MVACEQLISLSPGVYFFHDITRNSLHWRNKNLKSRFLSTSQKKRKHSLKKELSNAFGEMKFIGLTSKQNQRWIKIQKNGSDF